MFLQLWVVFLKDTLSCEVLTYIKIQRHNKLLLTDQIINEYFPVCVFFLPCGYIFGDSPVVICFQGKSYLGDEENTPI